MLCCNFLKIESQYKYLCLCLFDCLVCLFLSWVEQEDFTEKEEEEEQEA